MNSYHYLIDVMTAHGLNVHALEFNKLVRVSTTDKPNKRNGWYIAHETPVSMVIYGNWALGIEEQYICGEKLLSRADYALLHRQIDQAKQLRQQEQAKEWAINRTRIEQVLNECSTIKGTPVERYLRNRGIALSDFDELLYHPHLAYWENGEVTHHPAMIAKVTNPAGELVTLHRTYITADGLKANVSTPKKLMKTAGSMAGASIKLGAPTAHPKGLLLGIAEGIETALSASQIYDVSVWAGVSANGVKTFTPPPDVTHITFFSDNDETGINASKEAGKRLASQGLICYLKHPQDKKDWNDELAQDTTE